ncbi:MAG: ATP-binding protein [Chloroflexota bacterium]
MSANDLLIHLVQVLFALVFFLTLAEAVRRPLRANVDISLLFGAPALAVLIGLAVTTGLVQSGPVPNAINTFLVLAIPYLILRLLDDFSHVPRPLMRLSEVILALLVVAYFALASPRPPWYNLMTILYFVGLQLYATAAFIRESHRSGGVTRRRLQAVAAGSVLLGLAELAAAVLSSMPSATWSLLLFEVLALGSVSGYLLGFSPPLWLRHAWQEPELRTLLGRAASLPRLPHTDLILRELEHGAASSLGVAHASIGLWDESTRSLTFSGGEKQHIPPEEGAIGRAFDGQQPVFCPAVSGAYLGREGPGPTPSTMAVLAAPITAGERRLGVLVVYARRAPIFAHDDLALLQLLADQAAVILESRALIDEAAHVRVREEVTHLKEDFISAAAHDLRTPLTTILGQAQLLERRALRDPSAPTDLKSAQHLVAGARRMTALVNELLDASRAEEGKLLSSREVVDLATLVQDVCQRNGSLPPCLVAAQGPVIGSFDRLRISQLIDNLVGNAVKYSPDGAPVRVSVWREGEEAHLTVADDGIGIPPADLPRVFDRFHRAANVNDRQFAGMGLGLYICRAIVLEHGGRIWATSTLGQGATFHVVLPAPQVATDGLRRE